MCKVRTILLPYKRIRYLRYFTLTMQKLLKGYNGRKCSAKVVIDKVTKPNISAVIL